MEEYITLKTTEQRILKFFQNFVLTNLLIFMIGYISIIARTSSKYDYGIKFIFFCCILVSIILFLKTFLRKFIKKIQIDYKDQYILVFYSRLFLYNRTELINFNEFKFSPYKYVIRTKVYYVLKFKKMKKMYFRIFQEYDDFVNEDFETIYLKFLELEIQNHPENEKNLSKLKIKYFTNPFKNKNR